MLTQSLLDWFAAIIAGLVGLFPPLPPAWLDFIGQISQGGVQVGRWIAKLGPVVPFEKISYIMQAWIVALQLWAAVTLVRLFVWLAGR